MSTNPDITATEGRIPPRSAISALTLADETGVVRSLIERAQLSPQQEAEVASLARRLVHAVRAGRRQTGGVDAFMNEYSLSSEEGVVLMCLAEALLRIPDGETADKLIADKIGGRNWDEHVGKSDSLFVNASSWGLMLTGRFVGLGDDAVADFQGYLKRLVARSGEPIIRQAMRHAMRIMGKQFVLGRTVEEAMKVGGDDARRGYRFSFDMLGEAAMTAHDAERYLAAYENALKVVAAHAGPWTDDAEVFARPSISVKLSAIHPRYEEGQKDRVMAELVPRLVRLAELARDANLGLTVDAEEAERLDISLEVFAAAANAKALAGWNGLGLAVQAYGKRAHAVLEWLAELAGTSGRRLPVRLVKGAYWDTEIKRAQEQGLDSYPVFTRKASTDVSYLACARLMLDRPETFFPQFATHNAHTLSAITVMAGNSRDFEFQRLHGMGQALYEEVVGKDKLGVACRIYAPVGSHEDLLAYLVRRLLENGANTSFVNRLADDEAPIREIIADPVEIVRSFASIGHPRIPLPRDLFAPERANSTGIVLWEPAARAAVYRGMEASLDAPVTASAIVDGAARGSAAREVTAPHDRRVTVGRVLEAGDGDADAALASAAGAFEDWDRMGGEARARLLDRAADLFERDRMRLMAVIVREAGKTLKNALGDIREAVDFLRYYAARARAEFERPTPLPGPTGERNELSLHGRGVFVSISPWNFPLAIFTGQVAAGLAAGNTVIAKPAEQTPLIAYLAVTLMHEAGIPGSVLHLLPGDGAKVGGRLIADRRVAGVAFTGSNETAQIINRTLAGRDGPIVRLIAETGGMNAMIVDSTALPEQAVRDVVASAFDSAGQRCSAARILFVQEDIAGRMIAMLTGAMEELRIGDPWDFATDIGPVIDEDARAILDAHKARMAAKGKTLADLALPRETGHGTFVAPAAYEIDDIAILEREVFGPVLHVVRYRADRLGEVCRAINATGYGLTLGVHTRIETTASQIASLVRTGNIYVNRNQIGAVVGVQPFGGQGLSGTGPKAGGPHYLHSFAVERSLSVDVTASGGNAALMSLDAEEGSGRQQ
jgi:RHH-type transcriptional regulator, proline utilization regulon repressor / proline dehydrogenase / delta 1-pyrroline-5-carboxylate dehydrogenase